MIGGARRAPGPFDAQPLCCTLPSGDASRMSRGPHSFLLGFRTLAQHDVFQRDQACEGCGYNLRGLRFGQRCPECAVVSPKGMRPADPLLAQSEGVRKGLAIGLIGIAAALCAAVIGRLAFLVLGLGGVFAPMRLAYATMLAVEGCMFAGGAWLATPASFCDRFRNFREWMWSIRLLCLAWIPGVAALFMISGLPTDEIYRALSLILRGLGSAGILLLAAVYINIAREAQLDDASDRLRWIWLAAPLTFVASLTPPVITWIAAILLILLLLVWALALLPVIRGFFEIGVTAAWSERLRGAEVGREERIAQRRAEMDAAVCQKVRPVPRSEGDARGE